MSSRLPTIKLHRSPEGFEYAQVQGTDILIQYGAHEAGEWRQPASNDYQILILLGAKCEVELSSQTGRGKTNRRKISGSCICTVEKQTALAVRWVGPSAFAALSVPENFVARNGGTAAMTGVAIESASKYTSANGDISDFNEKLTKFCRDPMRLSPDQVHGWGLIQASQIIMARSRPPLGKKTRVLSDEQLEKINQYIEANLPNAISVETLARVAGVGKDQFARLFKQTKGRPPYHHVLRFRATRAQELIEEGKLSRSEIAERTGFSDQNHMKKTIRRLFGKSPKIRFCPENNTGASDTGVEKQGTLMGTL